MPTPLPKPRDLGKEFLGRDIGTYTPTEYKAYREREQKLRWLREDSWAYRRKVRRVKEDRERLSEDDKNREKVTDEDIEQERQRRREIGQLLGKGTFVQTE